MILKVDKTVVSYTDLENDTFIEKKIEFLGTLSKISVLKSLWETSKNCVIQNLSHISEYYEIDEDFFLKNATLVRRIEKAKRKRKGDN